MSQTQIVWLLISVAVIASAIGAAVWLLARRATRREEKLRLRLRDKKRQLVIASELQTEFVTNMSHELRTPLAGVLGLADLIQSEPLNSTQRHHLELLQDSTRGLLDVVDDLLDVGRLKSGTLRLELESIEFNHLIESIVGFMAPRAAKKGLRLECEIDPALPDFLVADPARLRQILLNLLSNAIKFTERGHVSLRARWRPSSRLRIEVEDTGIGIAKSAVKRLFTPFQQADSSTSRRFGGTGLGLAISKSLVDLMGGEIGVESRRSQGSTFWLEVPFTVPEPVDGPGSGDFEPGDQLAGRRILVVEDDEVNQLVVVGKLQSFGVDVAVAVSGHEALEKLLQGGFDLVLMDCQIPGLDGYETTRRIRQSSGALSEVPVIALTAHTHPDERARCLAAGMNGYLTKPVETGELFCTLQEWLELSSRVSIGEARAAR